MFESKPKLLQQTVFDGAEFVLRFPYHEALRPAFAEAGFRYIGAKDHPYYRSYRATQGAAAAFAERIPDLIRATAFQFHETDTSYLEKLKAATAKPVPAALFKGTQISVYKVVVDKSARLSTPDEEGEDVPPADSIAVAFPYHAGLNTVCSDMGGRYMPSIRGWMLANTTLLAFQLQLDRASFPSEQVSVMDGVYDLQATDTSISGGSAQFLGDTLKPSGAKPKSDEEANLAAALLARIPMRRGGSVSRSDLDAALRRYQLDPYQVEGVRHLLAYNSSLLADDMGLGKTRQSIVAADIARRGGQVMVVCPASVALNWRKEIQMVDPTARVSLIKYDMSASWIVTTYGQVLKLKEHARRFKVLICDEAHLLKEPTAKRTRETFDVAQHIESRMVLTGTPVMNSEAEIHTLLRLSGHPFGQYDLADFKAEFGFDSTTRQRLHSELKSWLLRRDKLSVLSLPGKERQSIVYLPSPAAREPYHRILGDASMSGLQKLGALRFALEKSKIPYALDMARALPRGEKMVVFCEYTDNVAELQRQLERINIRAVIYTGAHSKTARQRTVDEFQQDETIRVFIGTSGAAGVGITLVAANWVLFLGMPWTFALQEQAEDRTFRRGQLRPVHVRIPMVEKTIDEFIAELLKAKGDISEDVVKGGITEMLNRGLAQAAAA